MTGPAWWRWVREVVTFVLGVAVIIDALIAENATAELVVGLVMVGVLPLERLLGAIGNRPPG